MPLPMPSTAISKRIRRPRYSPSPNLQPHLHFATTPPTANTSLCPGPGPCSSSPPSRVPGEPSAPLMRKRKVVVICTDLDATDSSSDDEEDVQDADTNGHDQEQEAAAAAAKRSRKGLRLTRELCLPAFSSPSFEWWGVSGEGSTLRAKRRLSTETSGRKGEAVPISYPTAVSERNLDDRDPHTDGALGIAVDLAGEVSIACPDPEKTSPRSRQKNPFSQANFQANCGGNLTADKAAVDVQVDDTPAAESALYSPGMASFQDCIFAGPGDGHKASIPAEDDLSLLSAEAPEGEPWDCLGLLGDDLNTSLFDFDMGLGFAETLSLMHEEAACLSAPPFNNPLVW